MPEPVITIIAGVSAIVTNVWRISKDLYDLIDGINNAPRHIRATARDVQGFYAVLGALQGVLNDLDREQLPQDLILILESLHPNMENCLEALVELNLKIGRYTKPSGEANRTKWAGILWQFTERDTREFRGHLAAYKGTVNVALNAANLANSTRSRSTNERLEEEVRNLRRHVMKLTGHRDDEGSVAGENGSCLSEATDREYAINKFLETAESVLSYSPPDSPGMSATSRREPSPIPSISRSPRALAQGYDSNRHNHVQDEHNEAENDEFISNDNNSVNGNVFDAYVAPLRLRKDLDVSGSSRPISFPQAALSEAITDKASTKSAWETELSMAQHALRHAVRHAGEIHRPSNRPRSGSRSPGPSCTPNQIKTGALTDKSPTEHIKTGSRRISSPLEEPRMDQLPVPTGDILFPKQQVPQNRHQGSASGHDQFHEKTLSEVQVQLNKPGNRISSSDMTKLMDWLTVRDAQRDARETEHLVTLVRQAAEIRNDFQKIKSSLEKDHVVPSTGLKPAAEASDGSKNSASVQDRVSKSSRRTASSSRLSRAPNMPALDSAKESEAMLHPIHQAPRTVRDASGTTNSGRLPGEKWANLDPAQTYESILNGNSGQEPVPMSIWSFASNRLGKDESSEKAASSAPRSSLNITGKSPAESKKPASTTSYRVLQSSDSNKSLRGQPHEAATAAKLIKPEKNMWNISPEALAPIDRASKEPLQDKKEKFKNPLASEKSNSTLLVEPSTAGLSGTISSPRVKLSSQDRLVAVSQQEDFWQTKRKKKKDSAKLTVPHELDDINEMSEEDHMILSDMKLPTVDTDQKRLPPLPAATESDIESSAGNHANKMLRASIIPSWKLPEDGSPIHSFSRKKTSHMTTETGSNASQTSLLIEYFEGGNGRRPSVRVKVAPRKIRNGKSDVKITESKTRRPTNKGFAALNDKVKGTRKDRQTNNIEARRFVKGPRSFPSSNLMLEFAEGDDNYMRELNTLLDVVIRDLIRVEFLRSESILSTNPCIMSLFELGIAVEQIKHCHQAFPSCRNDPDRFIEWASLVGEVYDKYLNAWHGLIGLGYGELFVNLFRQDASCTDVKLADMMPHDSHGYVIACGNDLPISVALLLSRPSAMLARLEGAVKVVDRLCLTDSSAETATQYGNLQVKNYVQFAQQQQDPSTRHEIAYFLSASLFLEEIDVMTKRINSPKIELEPSNAENCASEISTIPAYSFLDGSGEAEKLTGFDSERSSIQRPSFEGLKSYLLRSSAERRKLGLSKLSKSELVSVPEYSFLDGLTKEGKNIRDAFIAHN